MQRRPRPDHRRPAKESNKGRPLPAVTGANSPPSHVEYRVGPGYPPKQYQFQKGQSGNPLGAKLQKRSIVPDIKGLLKRALNEKMPKRQGQKILTKAAAGIRTLVDQFACGDRNARRDLIQIADKLGIDLTAGEHDIQQSVAAALTQTDQEIVDEFMRNHQAERGHSRKKNGRNGRERHASRGDSLIRYAIGEIEPRVLNAMLRLDFPSFVWRCFHELYSRPEFAMNWHIHAICHRLEQVRRGKLKRLIINMPPGTLKSFITSVAWPAFILGHDPTKRVAVISYGSELAVTLGNLFRQIVNSPFYQELFPLMRPSAMKNTELEVRTTQNGFRLGTTIEGALTGLHADVIVVDEPIKALDAFSNTKRERVNIWFNQTLRSRLSDPRTGVIVGVMQRLHEDDLTGMLLRSSERWTFLSLPAIAEAKEWIPISDHQYHLRRAGDALHPERQTVEELLERREEVGPDTFAAQWQQCPTPASGTVIKRDWLRYYDHLPPNNSGSPIIEAWDLASQDGETNDWSVCTTWLYHERKYYLLDELRYRFQYPDLRDCAISHARSWKAKMVLLEGDMLGNALGKEMERAGLSVTILPPQRSKQMRAQIQSAKFRDSRVLFQEGASYLPELEAEVLAFPKGRFDDRVDSICLALSYEPPAYDLDKASAGYEKFASICLWQQQFWSHLK